MLTVSWYSSDDSAMCVVLPVLWITSCFHIMNNMARERREHSVAA